VQADAPSGGHGAATTAPQPHGRRPPGLTQVIPRESPPQQPGSPGAAPAASRAPPLVGHLWTAGSEAGSGTADLAVRSKTLNGKTFNPLLQFHQQMQMNRCRSTATSRSLRSKKDAADDAWCTAVRAELVQFFGSARDAFSALDLNKNGLVSLQEWSDGLERLPAAGGAARPAARELFKLLDERKAGSLRLVDLFPEEAATASKDREVSTPRFWSAWCSQPLPSEAAQEADARKGPRWKPTPEEEHERLVRGAEEIRQAEEKRKWIMSTTERLKRKGKSDSRCREIVARHLPRGTGPKDRHDVHAFSDSEVRACRKQYNDELHDHSRKIQQGISDMRDQRRVLHDYKHRLWEVTVEPTIRQRQMEEELRSVATSLVGEGPGLLEKVKRRLTTKTAPMGREEPGRMSPRQFSADLGLELLEAHNLHVLFTVFAGTSRNIRRRECGKLLAALLPGREVSAADVSQWWQQMLNTEIQGDEVSVSPFLARFRAAEEEARQISKVSSASRSPRSGTKWQNRAISQKEAAVPFERFATWWARFELRPTAGAAQPRAATAEDLPRSPTAAARPRAATEADALAMEDLDARKPVAAQAKWNALVNG